MKLLIIGLCFAGFLALLTLGVVAREAKSPDKADCLYAAAAAYPDWKSGQPRVTETVPECDDLPEADKQEIRTIMADFTTAAIRNLQKERS